MKQVKLSTGVLWGHWVSGSFSPNQKPEQKPPHAQIQEYVGSKHLLPTKEGGMFCSTIIIWSFMLYMALSRCTA